MRLQVDSLGWRTSRTYAEEPPEVIRLMRTNSGCYVNESRECPQPSFSQNSILVATNQIPTRFDMTSSMHRDSLHTSVMSSAPVVEYGFDDRGTEAFQDIANPVRESRVDMAIPEASRRQQVPQCPCLCFAIVEYTCLFQACSRNTGLDMRTMPDQCVSDAIYE